MQKNSEYLGPLHGVNVIDFGHYYAGPMVGMLLADQGANVIHIVKPDECDLSPQQDRLLNRNKKLVILDLKTNDGKNKALALIENADVVIENFRPGVMKRLGLDYAAVKTKNSGLIYLSLPGFSSTDKARAHLQGWEGILSAAACVFTQTSPIRHTLKFPPVYTWIPQCSTQGAIHGVIAIMAALISREAHGQGTVIEVPLTEAGLSAFSPYLQTVPAESNPDLPETLRPSQYLTQDSEVIQLQKLEQGRALIQIPPFYGQPYAGSDGRKLLIWAPDVPHFIERLFKVIGIDRQVKREGFVNKGPWVTWLDNNVSNGMQLSIERRARITTLITEALLTRPAEEWETLLQQAGVPTALIRTRDEWLALTPMHKSSVLTTMNDGKTDMIVPGRAVDVSGPNDELIEGFREPESMDLAQINALFNKTSYHEEVKTLASKLPLLNKGDLLKGLKVLDLTNLVAGPTSTYTLAQYGAEVIKADPPEHIHPGLIASNMEIYQGKRSILTDVTTAPGREVFNRLIRWADVIIHNSVDDTAARLGVTPAQVKVINPNALVCQFSAFGGSENNAGGWENRTGFDPLAQCSSGMTAHFGSLVEPHTHGSTNCDIMGGLGTSFAALLGIYQHSKTGVVGIGRCSLARMVNFIQLPHMISVNGSSDGGEARGQFAVGESLWQRLYQCSDGWIYVGTTEQRARLLFETVTGCQDADATLLETAFFKHKAGHWLTSLTQADIACHSVLSAWDICQQGVRDVENSMANETVQGAGEILRWPNHPSGNAFIAMAPSWVRVGEQHSYKRLTVAPRLGEHTRVILEELGYSSSEIEHLIRIKASHEYLPTMGSKAAYLFQPETEQ